MGEGVGDKGRRRDARAGCATFGRSVPLALLLALGALPRTGRADDITKAPPPGSKESRRLAAASGETSPREVLIDQVEVVGVHALTSEAVEAVIEIAPGEPLERAKVIRSAENLQALYRIHGYEEVGIRTQLVRRVEGRKRPENVLEFQINEGKPTRVAEVSFVPESPMDGKEGYETWQHLVSGMSSRVGLAAGDLLDQDKLSTGKRVLLQYLASEAYVGARADDVWARAASKPAGGSEDASRWVKLEIRIHLGDRVSFGFRGNTVLTTSRLNDLVDELRVQGFGKDFISAIQERIEKEYREMAFGQVQTKAYSYQVPGKDERHVTFEITEGSRVRLASVDFDGNNAFSSPKLLEEFKAKGSVLLQRDYYVQDDVQKAADLLVEWMKSKGYIGAKLITINTTPVPGSEKSSDGPVVKVIIYLTEGERTQVGSVGFSGLNVFKPEEASKLLGVQQGAPLNLFAFGEGIEALKAAYRARGYLSVTVVNEGTPSVVKYSDQNRVADIHLDLTEGPQYRVSQIRVEGRSQTREYVITREVALHEGDVVEEPKLAQTEANLRRLGIFSNVRVRTVDDPDHPERKIITISVEEASPGIIAGGPGFRNDLGIRAFGEIGYTNLWGMDHGIFLDAAVNRRLNLETPNFHFLEYQAQISYHWPWFAGWDVTFRPTINVSGNEYINFDATTVALGLNWEKRLLRDPNLTGLFTYSLQRVDQFNTTSAIDNQILRIGSVIPALRLDMRDNPLAPTSGLYMMASFELADPVLGSQRTPATIGYYRAQFRTDYTLPVYHGISLYSSFRSGYEKATYPEWNNPGGGGAIPLIEQFALGGIGSLRGWAEQELNYQTTNIWGSLSYVNYRTQLDLPVAGALRMGPFLDAANLIQDQFSFTNQMNFGTGLGIHYLTPVGPVNLDYGFKLGPVPGNQFYFSIGVI